MKELKLQQQQQELRQQQMEQQQKQTEARGLKDIARLMRSITTAGDIGKHIKEQPAWLDGLRQTEQLYSRLDAKEDHVTELMDAVLDRLPDTIEECAQLEALPEQSSRVKRKRSPANMSSSSDTLAESSSSQLPSGALTEAEVQKGWYHLLTQLQQAGKQHVKWHLHDTSKSGITGHGSKVDYCFMASSMKAWPQVVAMVELKKTLETESLHTECIGQLSARCEELFVNQPLRKFVIVIAGGADGLEVLTFFRESYTILRSGVLPLSFNGRSEGLRWLCKVSLSSFSALGFTPSIPPLTKDFPAGWSRFLLDISALFAGLKAHVVCA